MGFSGRLLSLPLKDAAPAAALALAVLRVVVVGGGAVPSAGGRRPHSVTGAGCEHPISLQTAAPCVGEALVASGVVAGTQQQVLPALPLHVTLEMPFKREKSSFLQNPGKNSTLLFSMSIPCVYAESVC